MVELVAVADLDQEKASNAAFEHRIPNVLTPEAMMAEPSVELIVNLTTPKAHAKVCREALAARKHVYVEKPLTTDRASAAKLLLSANPDGASESETMKIGAAPDTFLGAGLQTCRELIDKGAIGQPVGANAFMLCPGHEGWHPAPQFYYEVGGGPLLDMGPYYITALVSLLGPVKRVCGVSRTPRLERQIESEPLKGAFIQVDVPTHIVGIMEFESKAVGQITTSFDVWGSRFANIEIYGTEGTLAVPDPNGFGGPIHIKKARSSDWEEVPITRPYSQNSRGLGVMDMAYAIRTGRGHRASGSLAYHVLDVMQAILESAEEVEYRQIASWIERPAPLAAEVPENGLDT